MGHVTILNGFGISLGDSIIGLQALHVAQKLDVIAARTLLMRRTDDRPMVGALYRVAEDMVQVEPLPPNPPEKRFGRSVIDIRDFAFDPAFRGISMIDYFLAHLGIDPNRVPPALKRNGWLAPRAQPDPPAGLPERYVLVCPRTSMKLRDMPGRIHSAIVDRLRARTGLTIVTQGDVASDGGCAAVGCNFASRDGRIVRVPNCTSIQALFGLVARAELVVSADTAMVHLADAFNVPCLAFFPTHRPEWRVRDYPRCLAVSLPAPGLPEALEFPRDDMDIAAAHAAWFPQGDDLRWIDQAIDCVANECRPAVWAGSKRTTARPRPSPRTSNAWDNVSLREA